jgi:hypothetical protein
VALLLRRYRRGQLRRDEAFIVLTVVTGLSVAAVRPSLFDHVTIIDSDPVTLTAARSGHRVDLTVTAADGACTSWEPERIVARRAGRTLTAPLARGETCRYEGAIEVDDPGRWFVYAEIRVDGELAEAWIPVDHPWQDKDTDLYTAPAKTAQRLQIGAGVVLYAIVIAVMAAVAATYRRVEKPGN